MYMALVYQQIPHLPLVLATRAPFLFREARSFNRNKAGIKPTLRGKN